MPPEPLTRRLTSPDPRSLCPLSSNESVDPPEQNSWVRHCIEDRWASGLPPNSNVNCEPSLTNNSIFATSTAMNCPLVREDSLWAGCGIRHVSWPRFATKSDSPCLNCGWYDFVFSFARPVSVSDRNTQDFRSYLCMYQKYATCSYIYIKVCVA